VNVRVEELDGVDRVTISTAGDGDAEGSSVPPDWQPTPEKERV
jgi:hypothetical protein